MKISILFFLFSVGVTVALSEGDANREQPSSLRRRRVMGGQKDKKCNYVCPDNSEKKRNRDCYDTFDDCECLHGYIRDEQKKECVVDKYSCSEASVKRLYDMQSQCYSWAYSIRNMPKEVRIDEIDKLSDYMSGIWSDYNVVKESCEGHEEFGHRHLGVLGDFFKGFAQGFVGVFEDVIDIVGGVFSGAVGFVDDVFNGENVFDSLACNAVKTNTKVLGKLIDQRFNIATGGAAKLAKKDCRSSKPQVKLAKSVSSTVCALNKFIRSDRLQEVCDSNGDTGNEATAQFMKSFTRAICGRPGSAITDIISDVVTCEIGCRGCRLD